MYAKRKSAKKKEEPDIEKKKKKEKYKRATEAGVRTPGTFRCNTTVSRSANQSATLRGALVLTSFIAIFIAATLNYLINARSECKGSRPVRFIAMHKNVHKKEVSEEKRRTWDRKKEKRKIQARHGGGCSNPGHLSVQYHSKQIG